MNATILALLAVLPAATTGPLPEPTLPVGPSTNLRPVVSSTGCVAPPGMASLIDQDPTDEQLPWRRGGSDKVTIYFDASKVTRAWRADLEYGSRLWNKSPCLDARVVDACPTDANCVTSAVVKTGDDGNFDAIERDGHTVGGHIDFLDTLSPAEKKNVAVHEMGHAIGLKHRKTKHVLMNGDTYSDVFTPDSTDYQNLLFDYGRQEPTGSHTNNDADNDDDTADDLRCGTRDARRAS